MADSTQHLLRNPSPPLEDFCFDFEFSKVEEQNNYNVFGDACQFINLLDEDIFKSSSENEDIIFNFSDESSDSRLTVPPKKRKIAQEKSIPFILNKSIPLAQHQMHRSPNKKIKSKSYTKTQCSDVECLDSSFSSDDCKLDRTENIEIKELERNLIPVITSFRGKVVHCPHPTSADSREFSPLTSKIINVSYEKDSQKRVEENISFPSPSSPEITIVYESRSKNKMKGVQHLDSNNSIEKPNLESGKQNLKQPEVQVINQKKSALISIPVNNPTPNLKLGKQNDKQQEFQIINQKKHALQSPSINNPTPNLKFGKENDKQQEIQIIAQKKSALQSIPVTNPTPNLKFGKQNDKQQKVHNINQKKSALQSVPISNPTPNLKVGKQDDKQQKFQAIKQKKSVSQCEICKISLTEHNMRCHIVGKKHLMALRRRGLGQPTKLAVKPNNALESILPLNCYIHKISTSTKLVRTNKVSLLQTTADSCEGPLLGLNSVVEVRRDGNIRYYCKICDSVCDAKSIMRHLLGNKHRLRCFEIIDPIGFKNRSSFNTFFQQTMRDALRKYELLYGRGRILVEEEMGKDVIHKANEQPSQSCGNEAPSKIPSTQTPTAESKEANNISTSTKFVQTNKVSLLQVVADSCEGPLPGENSTSTKLVKINKVSLLQATVDSCEEPLPGLNSVVEIRSEENTRYHCKICDCVCDANSIMNHLLGNRHRHHCLDTIDPIGSIKLYWSKTGVKQKIRDFLREDELKNGRGRIQVEENFIHKTNEQPSQSCRNEVSNKIQSTQTPTAESKKYSSFSEFLKKEYIRNSPKIYSCDFCDYSNKILPRLRRHMQRHHAEKLNKCGICGICFINELALRRHYLVHS